MPETRKSDGPSANDDLRRLQDLILGEEKGRLHELDRRIGQLESRTEDVAEVLPAAMNRLVEDPVTRPGIEQPIVETIRGAIKRDTQSFAEALFPVLGPAIRRSIADALQSLVQRINVAMEHSFTVRGLRWRLESARTGVPFAQIVLHHTMVYAVQEAFLIQRETGLVLASVRRDEALALDRDAVSAMLTAIQAFIQDSLGVTKDEALRSAELGDRTLWVVNGPMAVLACVITGTPPTHVRDELMDVLETLHGRFGDLFDEPPERLAGHAGVGALMQETLKEELAEGTGRSTRGGSRLLWAIAGLVLLALTAWYLWGEYRLNERESRATGLFEAEPGYMLTSHETSGGSLYLAGLRDPLSRSPQAVLEAAGMNTENIAMAFRGYQSLDEEIVLRRLRSALGTDASASLTLTGTDLYVEGELTAGQYRLLEDLPRSHAVIGTVNLEHARLAAGEAEALARVELDAPESVTITPSNGVLVLAGTPPVGWFATLAVAPDAVGGWSLDFAPLRESLHRRFADLADRLDGHRITFSSGFRVAPASLADLDGLSHDLGQLLVLASALETDVEVILEGSADGVGSADQNREVALNRARTIQAELGNRGLDSERIETAAGQWQSGSADPDLRRVVVRVVAGPPS